MTVPKNYLLLCLLPLLFSCGKQVTYDGKVYSKHHVAMANLVVSLRCTDDGKSPHIKAYTVVTDNNGYFKFDQKLRKSRDILELIIQSDSASGGVYSMTTGGAAAMRGMEIVLE